MNALRIVVVMLEAPVPFGNAGARWFYVLLRELVRRGHAVTAFAACSRKEEMEEAAKLFPRPVFDLRCYPVESRSGIRAKWQSLEQPHSYLFSPRLRCDVQRELAQGFDILHLEQLWSGWVGLPYSSKSVVNVHYSFMIDLAGQRPRSLTERARRLRNQQAERYLLRQYPTICTLTPQLGEYVREISPGSHVYTVPLGIDFSLYPFKGGRRLRSGSPTLGLIGSFNWRPSHSAGQRLLGRLWPEIKKRAPEARLQIVGRCAESAFPEYYGSPGIEFHQDVPDILPYFLRTDVFLYAPVHASGMKVKILEAFALGVPVVTNHAGVEGLPAEDGVHAGISDEDGGLVERAVILLNDDIRRARMAQAARKLLEDHCGPQPTVSGMEAVYRRIVSAPAAKTAC